MTRAMLIESHTPKYFWPEALATAAYLINRLPTKILDFESPLHTLSELAQIPEALTLRSRIFGSSVFVHIPKHERTKLSPCAVKCVFIRYGVNQKGYRCYDPISKRVHVTMNCDFLESEYFFHHLSGQGENGSGNSREGERTGEKESREVDPLSWLPLPSPSRVDPPEKVDRTTEHVSIVQSEQLNGTAQDPPLLISDVSFPASEVINTTTPESVATNTETEDLGLDTVVSEIVDKDTGRYVLPPRSNRGVPPKRYSPEKFGKNTRYAIANSAISQLSEMARAFEAALCDEEEIPYSAEEAMKHKHWREAM